MPTYLALGDSMSIDDYTGVRGGGAVKRFFASLGPGWTLDDRTMDGCRMEHVPTEGTGEVISLTIGGNDLLWNREAYLRDGLASFSAEHLRLLRRIRAANPHSLFIVGDIYRPQGPLAEAELAGLAEANRAIRANCLTVGAYLATIHDTFLGHEEDYLCLDIEPTLAGAAAIAGLFCGAYREYQGRRQ
jgi:lysophospholipase L1-like esterase